MLYNQLLHTAIKAAFYAGKEIMKVYGEDDFQVETKDDDSPLTKADKAADQIIKSMLENTGIPVLSEEGKEIPYEARRNWKMFWLIDPLDGTKEFIKRNGEFTVNIALIEHQKPVAGVVFVPAAQEVYYASEYVGAMKMEGFQKELVLDQMLHDSRKLPLVKGRNVYTAVASRSHMSPETEAFIDNKKAEHGEVETISRGSSLKLCMVAEGKADIYPRFAPTMEWDTAAGHAIAAISGATVTNHETGEPLEYNKENLLNPWFVVERKR